MELIPKYDRAKSFYNKALFRRDSSGLVLVSYWVDVCKITNDGEIIIYELHSSTTIRHIVEFLKQNYIFWCRYYPDININQINKATLRKFIIQ